MRKTAKEHAAEVDPERRERLLKEKATLSILWRRASFDTLGTPEESVEGARGLVIEETVKENGVTYTKRKANPAMDATTTISTRQREIAKELSLWPGFQNKG
jgi:hypothetical protein